MEINNKIRLKLTPEDLNEAVHMFLASKGYKAVDKICWNVSKGNSPREPMDYSEHIAPHVSSVEVEAIKNG